MKTSTTLIALGLAGALSIGAAAPSFAGPLMSSGAAVRHRGARSRDRCALARPRLGPGLALGLAAGAFIAADVASRGTVRATTTRAGRMRYDAPVYAEPYAYEAAPVYPAPGYYAPNYGYGQCFTNDGYGRRRPCDAN